MKKYIIGAIVGICIAVTVISVWAMLNMRGRVTNLEAFAIQVSNIINQSQQPAKK